VPVRYFVDDDRGFLIGQASGVLRHEESIDALSQITSETDGAALFLPHLYFVDEQTELHELTFEGIMLIKDKFAALAQLYPGRDVKTAFVVPDKIHAAFAKMWQALAETHTEIGSTVELFDTEESAVAWLKR